MPNKEQYAEQRMTRGKRVKVEETKTDWIEASSVKGKVRNNERWETSSENVKF